MSSSACSRSSISKHRGAEMSSRLMPPNPGAIALTAATISSGSRRVQADRERVDAGELLEEHRLALHHRHGRTRADVAQSEHGRAVGHDGDRVALDRVLKGLVGILLDGRADPGDARRVGHREVVAGLQRALVVLLDLAAHVKHERPVGGVEHARARDCVDRVGEARPVAGVAGVDRDVAHVWVSSTATRSTAPIVPPASPIAEATLPSMPGTWSISTRRVRLYWALGVLVIPGAILWAAWLLIRAKPPAARDRLR